MPQDASQLRIRKILNYDATTDRPLGEKFDVLGLVPGTGYSVERLQNWPLEQVRIKAGTVATGELYQKLRANGLQVGQKVVLCHTDYYAGVAFWFRDCTGITLRDLTVWGLSEGFFGDGNKDIDIRNLVIDRKPGTNRLMSTASDGLHISHTAGFVKIADSQLHRMGDDAVNVEARFWRITSVTPSGGGYQLVLEEPQRSQQDGGDIIRTYPVFKLGEYLEFRKKSDLSLTVGALPISAQPQINWPPTLPTSPRQHTITVDDPIGLGTPAFDDWAVNLTRSPAVQITGCTITSNRRHGVILHSRNSIVDHCTFQYNTSAAIELCGDVRWFFEGPTPENVSIRDCTVDTVNAGAQWVDAGVCVRTISASPSPLGTMSSVSILRLTMTNTPHRAIQAMALSNLMVEQSTFANIASQQQDNYFMHFIDVVGTISQCTLQPQTKNQVFVLRGQITFNNNTGF